MKKNRIYISTTFAKDQAKITDVLNLCKKNNLNNVELGSNHSHQSNYKNILKKKDFSYLVHNYFPIPRKSFVVNIASHNKKIRSMSIRHAYRAIKLCKNINANLYTIHPGFLDDPISSNKNQKNYDFVWRKKNKKKNYSKSFSFMINSLKKIARFAKKHKIKVAIETEGSYEKKDLLLMQKPSEYIEFFKHFKKNEISINLNLGHLNLASKAFKFSKNEFIKLIQSRIIAVEISHNNGKLDQHLPLKKNSWSLNLLKNPYLKNAYKILEFRNSNVKDIFNSIKILNALT